MASQCFTKSDSDTNGIDFTGKPLFLLQDSNLLLNSHVVLTDVPVTDKDGEPLENEIQIIILDIPESEFLESVCIDTEDDPFKLVKEAMEVTAIPPQMVDNITWDAFDETVNPYNDEFTTYSSAVHQAIVMLNVAILATLQLVNKQSPISLITVSLYVAVFLLYAILRVTEVQLRPADFVRRFVGHTSHFFGALAAIGLISMVNVEFTCVLAFLLFLWIATVVFKEMKGIIHAMVSLNCHQSDDILPV